MQDIQTPLISGYRVIAAYCTKTMSQHVNTGGFYTIYKVYINIYFVYSIETNVYTLGIGKEVQNTESNCTLFQVNELILGIVVVHEVEERI